MRITLLRAFSAPPGINRNLEFRETILSPPLLGSHFGGSLRDATVGPRVGGLAYAAEEAQHLVIRVRLWAAGDRM